jgi:hypothetical protein
MRECLRVLGTEVHHGEVLKAGGQNSSSQARPVRAVG